MYDNNNKSQEYMIDNNDCSEPEKTLIDKTGVR